MIAAWILYVLVVGVLIASGARAMEEVCRVARLPVRCVWLAGLILLLLLAVLAPLRSTDTPAAIPPDPLARVQVRAAEAEPAAEAGLPGAVAGVLDAVRRVAGWPLRAAAPPAGGRVGAVLAGTWLVLSLALLALGAATLHRYRTSRREWPLREVAGTPVRVAPAVGPAVLGLVRPEIVLPEWLLRTPAESQRLVVLHEREHLRARDPLVLAAGCFAAALVPWHPAVWWMLMRLRLAVELDCDRRVLRGGVPPRTYGSVLIEIAGRGPGLSPGAPALVDSPSTLERRLIMMSTRFTRAAGVRAAALGALGALALLAACEAQMPTAAEVDRMDAASAEAHAQRWNLVPRDSAGVVYFVDGRQVSAEEARALAGDRITRVEVLRASGEANARIHLRTATGEADGGAATPEERLLQPGWDAAGAPGERRQIRIVRKASEITAGKFEGLILVDGVPAEPGVLRSLGADAIEHVEVVKGPAAASQSDDPRAAHGIIRITTRRGASTQ